MAPGSQNRMIHEHRAWRCPLSTAHQLWQYKESKNGERSEWRMWSLPLFTGALQNEIYFLYRGKQIHFAMTDSYYPRHNTGLLYLAWGYRVYVYTVYQKCPQLSPNPKCIWWIKEKNKQRQSKSQRVTHMIFCLCILLLNRSMEQKELKVGCW